MSAAIQALESLSKSNLPIPHLSPLVALVWKSHSDEKDAIEITSKIISILPGSTNTNANSSSSLEFITLDTLPFWIIASGIAGERWKTQKEIFLSNLALPLIRVPLCATKTFPLRTINAIYRATLDQIARLSEQNDSEIFGTIFAPLGSESKSNASTSTQSSSKSPTDIDLAQWTLEEIEKSGKEWRSLVSESVASEYLDSCLKYVVKSKEASPGRNQLLLTIIPKIISKHSGALVWNLMLHLKKPSSNNPAESVIERALSAEMQEEARLAYEVLVRFYDFLFGLDSISPQSQCNESQENNDKNSTDVDKREIFDLRKEPLFFENLLFPGLSSPDGIVRKRAIYIFKRIVSSKAVIEGKYWRTIQKSSSGGSQSSSNEPSIFDKYCLLMDSLDDHDLNIVKSMWPLFYQIGENSAPDLSNGAQIHDGFLKAFVRRGLMALDAKPLKKWMTWQVLSRPAPFFSRMSLDLSFCTYLLREVNDLFGNAVWRIEFAEEPTENQSDASALHGVPTHLHPLHVVSASSFHPFLNSVLSSLNQCEAQDQKIEESTNFSRGLIHAALTDGSFSAGTVSVIFSFFADETNNIGHVWPLKIYNLSATTLLLNSMQSLFTGYTNAYVYFILKASLQSLRLHIGEKSAENLNTVLLVLNAVPAYFRTKPEIISAMKDLVIMLDQSPFINLKNDGKDETSKFPKNSNSWLLHSIIESIHSVFDPSNQKINIARSMSQIRSFDYAQETIETTIFLLGLLPEATASSYLKDIVEIIFSYIDKQTLYAISTFAVLEDFCEKILSSAWSSFASQNAVYLKSLSLDKLLSENMSKSSEESDDSAETLNRSIDNFRLISSASTLTRLLSSLEINCDSISSTISQKQLKSCEAKQSHFEAFSNLGSFSPSSSTITQKIPSESVFKLILNILAFNFPHRCPSGLDGPAWKHFASMFEHTRWFALESICRSIDLVDIASKNSELLPSMLEACVERCENAHVQNISVSMKVLKHLLSLLAYVEVDFSEDDLKTYFERLVKVLSAEKTFTSRVVYHLMASFLCAPLFTSHKYSNTVISYTDTVFKWSESAVGSANWLVRLVERSIAHLRSQKSLHFAKERFLNLEEFVLKLIPTLAKLAMFGPVRNAGTQFPTNDDTELAGLKLNNVQQVFKYINRGYISASDAHAVHSTCLSDIHVRTAAISIIALLLGQDLPKFNTTFILYICGYPLETTIDEEGHTTPNFEKPQFHAFFESYLRHYAIHLNTKGSYAFHINYRRFQLLLILATRCEEKILLNVIWPILHADHLASSQELVTIASSILISRILAGNDHTLQMALMTKISKTTRDLLPTSPTMPNEDVLFASLLTIGYALQQVDLDRHAHLRDTWKESFLLILPFLSFNTLYIRATAQELLVNILKDKEAQLSTCLTPDFIAWLSETRIAVKALREMRPINRANRREVFTTQLLKAMTKQGANEEQRIENTIESLKLVFCLHPIQFELLPSEQITENAIIFECGRIVLDNADYFKKETKFETLEEGPQSSSQTSNTSSDQVLGGDKEPKGDDGSEKNEKEIDSSFVDLQAMQTPPITFQRKIVPWQSMDMSDLGKKNATEDKGGDTSKNTSAGPISSSSRQDIVIVASLLKKMPNLGGLTRTSEIFAASKLVLPSLSVVNDRVFQDLSVTAHNWLPMEEVAETEVKEYLLAQKSLGFLLIGLEQTSTSHELHHFAFPQKTVLLLGNEKRGIPVDLLQILDACVEIPQLGLIRSLNVHVSASICIWEYTKQHLPNK